MKNLDNVKYFVFSGGKTGTRTLVESISKRFGGHSVAHIHSAQHFKNGHPRYGDVKELMITNSKKFNKIYIIDSYREPFERGISSFFQNIEKHCPHWRFLSTEELINYFNNNNLYLLDIYHSYYESWGYFNVSTDVVFDFDKGYIIKEHENMVLVKTRLKESYRWDSIFSEIFGENISFTTVNKGEDKFYSDSYKSFKESYRLPDDVKKNFLKTLNTEKEFLDPSDPFYLSVVEMRKFMTKDEIESYIKKWII